MASPQFNEFCRRVCSVIRWRAARGPVSDELAAHLEDHAAALEAQGLDPETAARRAVEAMGDPYALGRQLNRAHPPLLHLSVVVTNIILTLLFIAFGLALAGWVWNTVDWKLSRHESIQYAVNRQPTLPMDEWIEMDGLRLHFFAAGRDSYKLYLFFKLYPDSGWLPGNSERLNLDIIKNVPGNVFYRFVDEEGRSYQAHLSSREFALVEQLPEDVERLWLEGDVFGHTFRVEVPMNWGEAS